MIALELIIVLIAAWTLLLLRPAVLTWTIIMAVVLFIISFYFQMFLWLIILFWLIFACVAIVANISAIRIRFISLPLLRYFRKVLPSMSDTEREALAAGDVWWERDLFNGRPNWEKLHAIPKPNLTLEERAFLENETETLCSLLDDWKIIQEDCDLTLEAWDYLKKNGFFGLVINKKYGGKGFSALAHSAIVTKIATRSMSAAVNIMVPNALGPGELLSHYGTEEQKAYYLPRLAEGKEIPCFALTSVTAGSDATAIQDTGVICKGSYQGKEIVGIKLNWEKRYITLAPIATVLGLAFKLFDPDHLLGQQANIGITLCLIPTSHPGVTIGKRHYPMNLAFQNGPTSGKDVFIPLDWIIGGQTMMGKGWRMLMECLSIGRAISLPALSTATGILCYYTTGMYAAIRKQFKLPLGQFAGVQAAMAYIAGNTYLLEASRNMTATAVDLKVKPSIISAIQKYHATELARSIHMMALDIHAGKGIQLGTNNYLGQIHFAMPMSITVEGANILTRNLIIFGQGAIRCHPYILEEMQAANEPDSKLAQQKFDRALKSHFAYTLNNIVRVISFGITNASFIKVPKNTDFSYYYRQLTRMSAVLALISDLAMLFLGGQLKRKERLSARLGDVLSYLYLATTLLKYYREQGANSTDKIFVKWGLDTCLFKIQKALLDFLRNFPKRGLARLLRILIFPYGANYCGPSDQLESQLANMMMTDKIMRERLAKNMYRGDNIEPLEHAFNAINEVVVIEEKLQQAIKQKKLVQDAEMKIQIENAVQNGIIDSNEAERLIQARLLLQQALQVDVFAKDYLANRMCDKHIHQS